MLCSSSSARSLLRQPTARPPCVLLIDDDSEFSDLLSQALREDGIHVIVGSDGCELMDYVLLSLSPSYFSPRLDLVVSDIRMPKRSGLEALATLRERRNLPPFLLMTAFGSHAVHDIASRLGAVGVIDKPFDIEDFCTIVGTLVGSRQ